MQLVLVGNTSPFLGIQLKPTRFHGTWMNCDTALWEMWQKVGKSNSLHSAQSDIIWGGHFLSLWNHFKAYQSSWVSSNTERLQLEWTVAYSPVSHWTLLAQGREVSVMLSDMYACVCLFVSALPWLPPWEDSDTLTVICPVKELTPIMLAWTELLVSPVSWLWLRGTL